MKHTFSFRINRSEGTHTDTNVPYRMKQVMKLVTPLRAGVAGLYCELVYCGPRYQCLLKLFLIHTASYTAPVMQKEKSRPNMKKMT